MKTKQRERIGFVIKRADGLYHNNGVSWWVPREHALVFPPTCEGRSNAWVRRQWLGDGQVFSVYSQPKVERTLIGYRIKRADGLYADGSYRWVIQKAAFLFTNDVKMTAGEWAYGHLKYLLGDCHVVGVYRRTKP